MWALGAKKSATVSQLSVKTTGQVNGPLKADGGDNFGKQLQKKATTHFHSNQLLFVELEPQFLNCTENWEIWAKIESQRQCTKNRETFRKIERVGMSDSILTLTLL